VTAFRNFHSSGLTCGVVVPDFGRNGKLGTQEGGTQLRHQFLEGVGFRTEPLPVEFPRAQRDGWPRSAG
jgi:hypothetical protein